jgi:hypothetical protein
VNGKSPVNLSPICHARAPEDALNDNNVLKFERPKPPQDDKNKSTAPKPKKGLIWIAVVAGIALVWAYYQFIAPPTV